MQRNCGLYNAQIRPDMTADFAVAVQNRTADFPGQRFKFFCGELFYVLRRINGI